MLEDRDIVRRCQCGRMDLTDVLVDRYGTALYTLCRKLTGDPGDADDLFQDTWVRAVKNIKQCRPDRKFVSWLFAICVNRYRDRYRKRKRWLLRVKEHSSTKDLDREMAGLRTEDPSADEDMIRKEKEAMVRKALARLDDTYRIPLVLHYFRELGIAEVAQILDIPDGTVKSRLSRGREILRASLKGVGNA